MLPPVPRLDDYGISSKHGFLPEEPPLEALGHPYYKRWEQVVSNLQALLLSRRLRQTIETLPIITASRLREPAEWRRAYVLLSFMTHAYIWGGDRPVEVRLLGFRGTKTVLWLTCIAESPTIDLYTIHTSVQLPRTSYSRDLRWRMPLEL